MAGQKSNTIEYVFQGNTLSLQQAIKKVSDLLASSTRQLKKYQDGTLTEDQEAKLKATRLLLRRLRAAAKEESKLDEQKRKRTLIAGREALRQARGLASQASKIKLAVLKAEAAEQERLARLSTTAQKEATRQNAAFLEEYADRLVSSLSEDAYYEITQAVREYNEAMAVSGEFTAEQADASARLNEVYKEYAKTLGTAIKAQDVASRGIRSFEEVIEEVQRYIENTLTSVSFWLQMLRRVITVIQEGVQASADYAESINYLSVVSKQANEELEEFIRLQERAFGSDPTQLRTTAAMFYQIGNSLNWSNSEAALLSESFTKLAQDMASLQNVDLETATEKLRSGLTGQSKALKAWGIDVQDATIEEWLLTKGINASMESMNEASQTAARYAFILDKTSSAQGDLARTLESPANQFKILNTQVHLLFQNIGSLLIPTLTFLARIANAVLQPINALLGSMTSSAVTGYTDGIGEATEETDMLAESLEEVTGLTGIDEINQFSGTATANVDTKNLEDAEQEFSAIDEDLQKLLKDYDNNAEGVNRLIDVFGKLGDVLAPVFNLLSTPLDAFLNVFESLAPIFDYVAEPLGTLLDGLSWLLDFLLTPIVGVIDTLTSNTWLLVGALSAVLALLAVNHWSSFLGILAKMYTSFQSVAAAVWKGVAALVKWIGQMIIAAAKAVAATYKNWILAGSYWKVAIASIAAAGLAALAVTAVVMTATSMASGKADESLGSATDVPAMAKGGVVTGPTFALIGEGRYNEAVMPLGNSPQFREMRQSIAAETAQQVANIPNRRNTSEVFSRSGSSNSRPIILQLNGKEVARALFPDLGYTQNQTGVRLK